MAISLVPDWDKVKAFITEKLKATGAFELMPVEQDADLLAIYEDIYSKVSDGITYGEVLQIAASAVNAFMVFATKYNEVPGGDKRQFVIKSCWVLYQLIDKHYDGSKNRINIPWVVDLPGFAMETKIEEFLCNVVIPIAIESVYKAWAGQAEEIITK